MEVKTIYGVEEKNLHIHSQWKVGKIQEKILEKWSLLIYNIEYTIIQWKGEESEEIVYLGSSDFSFDQIFLECLNQKGKGIDDVECMKVIERRRDEKGNVVKENRVIESFQRYMQMEEDERMARNQEMLGGFPLPRIQVDPISPNLLDFSRNIFVHQPLERDEQELHARVDEEIGYLMNTVNEYVERRRNGSRASVRLSGLVNTDSDLLNRIERDILREIRNPFMRAEMSQPQDEEETKEEDEESTEEEEELKEEDEETTPQNIPEGDIEITMGVETELDGNILNRIPLVRSHHTIQSIFDATRVVRFPLRMNHQDILNSPINMNLLSGLMTNIFGEGHFEVVGENVDILNRLNEDVKVVIDENEFEEKLHHSLFEELNVDEEKPINHECSICTETFKSTDSVIYTPCHHVFHRDCIKPWLCNESTKCPMCREEIIKGHPK